jgi:protein involved in sex pheromone biosynthesis
MKRLIGLAVIVVSVVLVLAACGSNADKASKNISTKCEQFQCQRRIVGVNGITDKVEFLVEGRCSIEGNGLGNLNALVIVCKQGPHEFKKHYVGMSDNMFFVSTQIQPLAVNEFRTKVILKPQNIVPDLDLVTG